MPIYNLSNEKEFEEASDFFNSECVRGSVVEIKIAKKQRTNRQNAAIHKLFTNLAEDLNNHGLYMMKVLRQDAEIQWTPGSVKEYLWRPIMKAQLGKESTTQMTTTDIDKVFETLNKHLAEKFQISLEFPSIDSLLNLDRGEYGKENRTRS